MRVKKCFSSSICQDCVFFPMVLIVYLENKNKENKEKRMTLRTAIKKTISSLNEERTRSGLQTIQNAEVAEPFLKFVERYALESTLNFVPLLSGSTAARMINEHGKLGNSIGIILGPNMIWERVLSEIVPLVHWDRLGTIVITARGEHNIDLSQLRGCKVLDLRTKCFPFQRYVVDTFAEEGQIDNEGTSFFLFGLCSWPEKNKVLGVLDETAIMALPRHLGFKTKPDPLPDAPEVVSLKHPTYETLCHLDFLAVEKLSSIFLTRAVENSPKQVNQEEFMQLLRANFCPFLPSPHPEKRARDEHSDMEASIEGTQNILRYNAGLDQAKSTCFDMSTCPASMCVKYTVSHLGESFCFSVGKFVRIPKQRNMEIVSVVCMKDDHVFPMVSDEQEREQDENSKGENKVEEKEDQNEEQPKQTDTSP